MGALEQVTAPPRPAAETVSIDTSGSATLCTIRYASEDRLYDVTLGADLSSISLEGMNHFHVGIASTHKASGTREKIHAILDINIREEMNSISIEGDAPLYFTITRKSLDLMDEDIDSSIHEVVDLGLLELRINTGSASRENGQASLLFDSVAGNLVKAGVSTLLAQSTQCHRHVIQEANHLFASRQDYVREMCKCLNKHTDAMANSVTTKVIFCDQGFY